MPLGITPDFNVRFEQAVTAFQSRVPMLRGAEFDAIGANAHQYAFTVAGITQISLVNDVWQAIDKALLDGTDFKQFKKDVGAKLESAWGGAKPARLETIYRTNIQSAYNAGRYRMLTSPAVLAARPIWIYDSVLDSRTSGICKPLNGVTLPAKDPFWATHQPPLHFSCRSSIRTARDTPDTQHTDLSNLTLEQPSDGFGIAPFSPVGHPWEHNLARFPEPLRQRAQAIINNNPPPPPISSAANILHLKTGAQAGSNAGGFYTGLDGIKRYVKFYDDAAQAHGEHLANQIYRLLGLDAPETLVFEDNGKHVLASTILENKGTLGAVGLTKKLAVKALDGFAADVLTANWDAAGLSLDNMVLLDTGNLARIDQGGTFLMRAKNGRKATNLLETISEWTGFPSPSINPAYAQLWQKAGLTGPGELANKISNQIKAIEKLEKSLGGWRGYVEAVMPTLDVSDRDQIITMLEKRTGLLTLERKTLDAIIQQKRAAKKAVLVATSNQRVVFDYSDAATWASELEQHKYDVAWLKKEFDPLFNVPDPFGSMGQKHIQDGIQAFTSGYKDSYYQRGLYESWIKIHVNQQIPDLNNPIDYAVAYSAKTRAERWALLAKKIGLPATPTHIRAHRGLKNKVEPFIEDILHAWMSGKPTMELRQYAQASWGMNRKSAERFASKSLGVIFKHEFALEDTFVDQLIDDSSFVKSFMFETEVIAGVDQNGKIIANVTDQVIYMNGKEYTFADRSQAVVDYLKIKPKFDVNKKRPKIKLKQ
jgi:SPP1 gp7 family putative phage head morphogenesis protein